MAILGIQTVENKDFAFSDFSPSGKGKLRTATRKDGDAASFSSDALKQLKGATGSASEGLFGSVAKAKLGDGTEVSYNNSSGTIRFGGTELKLGFKGDDGKAFAAKNDNLTVGKNAANETVVMNNTTGKSAVLDASGKVVKDEKTDADGKKTFTLKAPADTTFVHAMNLNRSGTSAGGVGTGSNVIINTAADAVINGSALNDKVFNFSAKAKSITGAGGSDAVYSVGLNNSANISMGGVASTDLSYVKLIGNMKGGTVNMNGEVNMLDATGKTLTDVGVTSSDTAGDTTTAVVASALNGAASSINLGTDNAAIDLNRLSKGAVTMGTGNNSLTINSVVGDDASKAKITTSGVDTLNIKAINKAEINQANNKSSWMKLATSIANSDMTLGKGDNSIDAGKATFNKTNITQDASATGSTSIAGKSFTGDKNSKNNITLSGNGNSVSFSGTVSNANIALGTGANTLDAGSLNNAIIRAGVNGGAASSEDQSITVKGGAKNSTYTGSDGDDNVSFGGAVSNSTFDLGAGDNSLVASKTTKSGDVADQNLTNVNITSTGSGSQTIMAKSLTTSKKAGVQGTSTLTLSGASLVSLSGTVGKNTNINLGSNANTVYLGSVSGGKDDQKANISMGGSSGTSVSGEDQTLIVKGGVNRANLDIGGTGDITVEMGGNLANANVALGHGTINMTLAKVGARKTSYKNITNTNITTGSNASTTLNAGAIVGSARASTSITLGNGTNNVSLAGSIGPNTSINLGSGSNTLTAKSINGTKNQKVNITVASGGGQNTFAATTMNIGGGAKNLTYTGNENADRLSFKGAVSNALLDVGQGDNSLEASRTARGKTTAQTLTNVEIKGASASATNVSSMTMNVGALRGNSKVDLQGNNSATIGSVAAGTTLDFGVGSNNVTISKGITGTNNKKVTIQFGAGGTTNSQNVTINGNVTGLNYVGSSGADTLKIKGSVKRSNIDLKSGVDNLSIINSVGKGAGVSDTKITATGNSNVTAGSFTTSKNGKNEISLGHGTVSVGNISGNTSFTLGTGSSTMTMGVVGGKNVKIASSGEGDFTATSIGAQATFDFTSSSSGNVSITTTTGGIGNSTLSFGSNSVTIITGSTVGATGTVGNTNMSGSTINATNATTVDIITKNITGATDLNLGGTSSVTANSIGGTTDIVGGTGSTTIKAKSIAGSITGGGVSIDVSNMSAGASASVTVEGDATNFTIDAGNSAGTLATSFGTVNENTKITRRSASIAATNASSITTAIMGSSRNLTYTGSETGEDDVSLGGTNRNSTFSLGAGDNTLGGTNAGTGASMVNSSIKDTAGATTSVTLNSFISSGGGSGSILLQGNQGSVTATGAISGAVDITINSITGALSLTGPLKGVSERRSISISMGSAGVTGSNHSFTLGGTLTNVNVIANGNATGSITGRNVENLNVTMLGQLNKLNLGGTDATTVKNVDINMGSKDKASTDNSLTVGSAVAVDATKDKGLEVNFDGGAGSKSTIDGASTALTNTNIMATSGSLTVNLRDLSSSTVSQGSAGQNLNLNVTNSLTGVTVNAASGSSVTVGSTTTTMSNTVVSGDGINMLKMLGKELDNISITDKAGSTAIITIGDAAATKSVKNLTVAGDRGTNITVNASTASTVDVTKGGNLVINAATVSSLNANVSNVTVGGTAAFNTGSDINLTASNTITVSGDNVTNLNITGGTGNTTVNANAVTGGNAVLKGGNANMFTIVNNLTDFNVTNNGTGSTTISGANLTTTNGSFANTGTGKMTLGGVDMSGSVISASNGTMSVTTTNVTGAIVSFTGGNGHEITGALLNGLTVNTSGSNTAGVTIGGASSTINGGVFNQGNAGTMTFGGANMSNSATINATNGSVKLNTTNVTGATVNLSGGKDHLISGTKLNNLNVTMTGSANATIGTTASTISGGNFVGNSNGKLEIKGTKMEGGANVTVSGSSLDMAVATIENATININSGTGHKVTSTTALNNVTAALSTGAGATISGAAFSGGSYTNAGGTMTLEGTTMSGSKVVTSSGGTTNNNVGTVTSSDLTNSGGTLNVNASVALNNSTVNGGTGKLNLSASSVSGSTITGGTDTSGTISITTLASGTVNLKGGKTAIGSANGGKVNANFANKATDLLTVGTNNGGAFSVTGGNLHLKANTTGNVELRGDAAGKILTFTAGNVTMSGTSTLDMSSLIAGKVNFAGTNGTNALAGYGTGGTNILALGNVNINGVASTAGVTASKDSTVTAGNSTNYGTLTDTI